MSIVEKALADKKASDCEYLDKLNREQREAAENTTGPLLVLAGAGTGKTTMLTTRIAHILKTGQIHADGNAGKRIYGHAAGR